MRQDEAMLFAVHQPPFQRVPAAKSNRDAEEQSRSSTMSKITAAKERLIAPVSPGVVRECHLGFAAAKC